MTDRLRGHHLIYGIGTAESSHGWSIIAASAEALKDEIGNDLVDRTTIGRVSVQAFEGAIGHFGGFDALNRHWHILARFCRSLEPDITARHFVQRDIFLVSQPEFRAAGADAAAFLDRLPGPRSIERRGTPLPQWEIEYVAPDTSRLSALDGYAPDFIAKLLTSIVREPTTLYSKSSEPDLIPALFLLLPVAFRITATFCTTVGEGSPPLQVKTTKSFPTDAQASIVEVDKRQFVRLFEAESFAIALVASWQKRGDSLAAHHRYLDRVLEEDGKPGEPLCTRLELANRRWASHQEVIAAIGGEGKWEAARTHLQLIEQSAADRNELAEQLIRNLRLPGETQQFIRFLKALRPKGMEQSEIEKRVAERVAGQDTAAATAAVRVFDEAWPDEGADGFIMTLFRTLGSSERKVELALAIAKQHKTLSAEARNLVLKEWSFGKPTKEDVGALFAYVASQENLAALHTNGELERQIAHLAYGPLALGLAALSVGQSSEADRAAAVATVVSIVSEHPESARDAISVAPRAWQQVPEIALPLTVVLASHATPSEELARIFSEAYEAATPRALEAMDTADLEAARNVIAARFVVYKKRFALADAKRRVDAARRELREAIKYLAKWSRSTAVGEIFDVINSRGEPFINEAAWCLAVLAVADDPDVAALLDQCRDTTITKANPLLAMMAILIVLENESRENWGELLHFAAAGLASIRGASNIARIEHLLANWKPSDAQEVDTVRAAFSLTSGAVAAGLARQGVRLLIPSEQALAGTARLLEANELLKSLDVDVGEIARLQRIVATSSLADEQLAPIRNAAESLSKRLSPGFMKSISVVERLTDLLNAIKAAQRSERTNADSGERKTR